MEETTIDFDFGLLCWCHRVNRVNIRVRFHWLFSLDGLLSVFFGHACSFGDLGFCFVSLKFWVFDVSFGKRALPG